MTIQVTRLPIRLLPDPSRVITRQFVPGEENRLREIVERLLAISESEVATLVLKLENSFRPMHPDIDGVFLENFEIVTRLLSNAGQLSETRKRFIGACFTMEYAIEAAALFNPSMVPAIDQSGVPTGSKRFVMSLRATGEGHISSIVFRQGLVDSDGQVSVDPPGKYSRTLAAVVPDEFDKEDFISDLCALGAWTDHAKATMADLGGKFTRAELSDAIDQVRAKMAVSGKSEETFDDLLSLTRSNYGLDPPSGTDISEVVIFPFSDNERHGVEDMRLVCFWNDDGSTEYYGTYTAYNGFRIFPQLLNYRQGGRIEIQMLSGSCAKNKGMALFPRKIGGNYAMVARLDNENLYYMESGDVGEWDDAQLIQRPKYAWEVIQIGNCGSPIETDAGWLMLTHGVGPMRQYCIGATLLDRDDPRRIIGRTSEPILIPSEEERFGYVPNVVYSCGGMIHKEYLVLPYAMSDMASSIALINIHELLETLEH